MKKKLNYIIEFPASIGEKALIDYGFNVIKLDRIVTTVHTENIASVHIFNKIIFIAKY